ncbi:endonuclease/exonuclease/phosphatase family protein [Lishizhenia sp.]|uniref:endonuclease/exonuclease/phosphatase family protein n=1 Tax=Lishizhenia sp. TaxID=2497594 RepID=UPI00299F1C5C|nr:endonuclease/exonuclease/phosphatase family protein [Lishizhenia sp.]MDX1446057.1 endonuclease/exonuclease/phosphatase family protein [Lishizhenia sp.]
MSNKKKRFFSLRTLMHFFALLTSIALLLSYVSVYVPPKTLWILPLFGLVYPLLLVFTLLFLIYFTFGKSRWFLLPLVVILLGGKLHFRYINLGWGQTQTVADQTLKITSYNVRLFDFYLSSQANNYDNKDSIMAFIKNENPDILCLQEYFYTDGNTEFNTKKTLTKLLKSKEYHERVRFQQNKKRNFGVSIFSKYPIISKGEVSFPASATNYCIYTDVKVNEDTLRVYNTHLQSVKIKPDDVNFNLEDDEETNLLRLKTTVKKLKNAYPARTEQAQLILKHAAASPYPVIICGDFNDPPISHTYNLFNKVYKDAFRNAGKGLGRSYAGKIPAGRIDYIWHDVTLGSQNFKVQDQAFSDHYAITAEIILP